MEYTTLNPMTIHYLSLTLALLTLRDHADYAPEPYGELKRPEKWRYSTSLDFKVIP